MSKFTITVASGIADVFPHGMGGKAKTMKAGESLDCETFVAAATSLYDSVKVDLAAPAAGVATNEPFGKRDGTVVVKVVDGAVKIRRYASSEFTEHEAFEGDTVTARIIESNRITLAVYEASGEPKS